MSTRPSRRHAARSRKATGADQARRPRAPIAPARRSHRKARRRSRGARGHRQRQSVVMARHVDIKHAIDVWRYMAGGQPRSRARSCRFGQPCARPAIRSVLDAGAGRCRRRRLAWNFPMLHPTWKSAPALAAGCTVVLKPAENIAYGASARRTRDRSRLSERRVHVVTGAGPTAGAALVEHPGVDKVTFTGSTEVGRLIVKGAAGNMRR